MPLRIKLQIQKFKSIAFFHIKREHNQSADEKENKGKPP